MNALYLVVFGLATWRVSALFTRESGPFHVFEKIREKAGIQHDQDGNVSVIPGRFFAELLSCVWCASIWAATFWAIFSYIFPEIAFLCALPFALSTVAILIDKVS